MCEVVTIHSVLKGRSRTRGILPEDKRKRRKRRKDNRGNNERKHLRANALSYIVYFL